MPEYSNVSTTKRPAAMLRLPRVISRVVIYLIDACMSMRSPLALQRLYFYLMLDTRADATELTGLMAMADADYFAILSFR